MKKLQAVNFYRILNIPSKAKASEIKEAYLRLAKIYHPDKNRGNPLAEKKFSQINSAYQVLKDPKKRKELDESLKELEKDPSSASTPLMPFSAVSPPSIPSGKEKGIDLELVLKLSMEDLCQSRTVPLSYLRPVNGTQLKSCLEVKIPPNAKAGSKLCFREKGGAEGLKKFGRLYVRLELKPHKIFRLRENFDLFVKRPLPFISAMEAGRINVPSPYGVLSLKIGAFFKDGQIFKIKEKGLPKDLKGSRGDLYVQIYLEYPDKKEQEIKACLSKLSVSEKRSLLRKFKEEFIFPKTLKFEKKMQELDR